MKRQRVFIKGKIAVSVTKNKPCTFMLELVKVCPNIVP